MAALALWGYLFLGLGPGTVFFFFFIAPKSFLVLLAMTSAFYWLVVLLLTASIFRGFVPVKEDAGAYAGVVIGSVVIQEIARYGVWRLHKLSATMLADAAEKMRSSFGIIDKLYMALAWGYGHAACHAIFFFAYLIPLTAGHGTFYLGTCPSMSLFLANALYANAFGLILTAAMLVALEGWHTRNAAHIAFAPALHLAAGLLTIGSFQRDGCLYVVPLLFVLGVLSSAYAGLVAWRKGGRGDSSRERLQAGPTSPGLTQPIIAQRGDERHAD